MKILEANHLVKSFGSLEVLKDISIEVKKGEVLAIIGPSGSGKSTLLRCITQLEDVDNGEIVICGETLCAKGENGKAQYASKQQRRKIGLHLGLVFQNFNLFPHLSVIQNVMNPQTEVLKKSKAEAEKHAKELLAKVGLTEKENAYPCELSGGQQQRVSIARAMAMNPDLLLFDEPTSALDPELTGEILKVIKGLAKLKTTMVIVTHEMSFAKNVADRVVFMDNGYIIADGTPSEIFDNTDNTRIREFLAKFDD